MHASLSQYAQASDVNAARNDITTLQTAASGYARTTDLSAYVQNANLSNYVQTADLNGYARSSDLSTLETLVGDNHVTGGTIAKKCLTSNFGASFTGVQPITTGFNSLAGQNKAIMECAIYATTPGDHHLTTTGLIEDCNTYSSSDAFLHCIGIIAHTPS
jgi:hypothetical protein